jgi:cephalosporin hydroxylase
MKNFSSIGKETVPYNLQEILTHLQEKFEPNEGVEHIKANYKQGWGNWEFEPKNLTPEYKVCQNVYELANLIFWLQRFDFQLAVHTGTAYGGTVKAITDFINIKETIVCDFGEVPKKCFIEYVKPNLRSTVVEEIWDDIKLPSTQLVLEKYSNKIDLVYIDDDHEIEHVRWEFDRFHSLCKAGAIIVLHDATGLHKVWKDKFWEESKFQVAFYCGYTMGTMAFKVLK